MFNRSEDLTKLEIPIEQLQDGVFIELSVPWADHPFLFNKFKIKTAKQIAILKTLGLTHVTYIPEKSDKLPLSTQSGSVADAATNNSSQQIDAILAQKRERIEKHKIRRKKLNECENRYQRSVGSIKNVMRNLLSRPEEAVGEAAKVVDEIVTALLDKQDFVVQLMGGKGIDENAYYHSLNVAMLSLMLGKQAGFGRESMEALGVGALLHDIGKGRVPSKILMKKDPLNKAELSVLRMHCQYGREMAENIEGLPSDVLLIIAHHHELNDRSGYPDGINAATLPLSVQITTIANTYDNLCNCMNPKLSMTPYEALSYMFKTQKEKLNSALLAQFIRCLGIYPPGSLIKLSNDMVGMVISVNSANLLAPTVLVYDPDIPKEEAIIHDLMDDEEIKIIENIRPGELPREIFEYLSPRTRVNYYFDTHNSSTVKPL